MLPNRCPSLTPDILPPIVLPWRTRRRAMCMRSVCCGTMPPVRTTDNTHHFPGVRSSYLDAAVSRRDRILIPATVVLITALSWAYLVHLARQMSSTIEYDNAMATMGMAVNTPWTRTDVFLAFAMWAVLMVG